MADEYCPEDFAVNYLQSRRLGLSSLTRTKFVLEAQVLHRGLVHCNDTNQFRMINS